MVEVKQYKHIDDVINLLKTNSKMLKGNPFYPNTVSFKEWERGFNVAYYRNLERLDEQSEARSRKSFQKIGGEDGK